MGRAATVLSSVLERERKAAISADIDALSQLQHEKRLAMAAMASDETSDEELGSLRSRAMASSPWSRKADVAKAQVLRASPATSLFKCNSSARREDSAQSPGAQA